MLEPSVTDSAKGILGSIKPILDLVAMDTIVGQPTAQDPSTALDTLLNSYDTCATAENSQTLETHLVESCSLMASATLQVVKDTLTTLITADASRSVN